MNNKENLDIHNFCNICDVKVEKNTLICTMCLHNRQNDIKEKLNLIPDTSNNYLQCKYWVNMNNVKKFLNLDFMELKEENIDLLDNVNNLLFT